MFWGEVQIIDEINKTMVKINKTLVFPEKFQIQKKNENCNNFFSIFWKHRKN